MLSNKRVKTVNDVYIQYAHLVLQCQAHVMENFKLSSTGKKEVNQAEKV